jgi:hypothetical protein
VIEEPLVPHRASTSCVESLFSTSAQGIPILSVDAGKRGIRDKEVVLPRRVPLLETFAEHLASDAKRLIEDEETGAKSYRYIRTGTNHYSLAFTYDWLASEQERRTCGDCFIDVLDDDDDSMRSIMWPLIRMHRNEGFDWPPRWDRMKDW